MKEMTELLHDIFQSVSNVSDELIERCGESLPESQEGDEFIGVVMDPWTKALFTRHRQIGFEAARVKTEIENPFASDEQKETLAKTYSRLDATEDVLRELFWLTARVELNAFCINVGLRKNWSMVACPEQTPSTGGGMNFLKWLLSGGANREQE